jgi:hypothetical protein
LQDPPNLGRDPGSRVRTAVVVNVMEETECSFDAQASGSG